MSKAKTSTFICSGGFPNDAVGSNIRITNGTDKDTILKVVAVDGETITVRGLNWVDHVKAFLWLCILFPKKWYYQIQRAYWKRSVKKAKQEKAKIDEIAAKYGIKRQEAKAPEHENDAVDSLRYFLDAMIAKQNEMKATIRNLVETNDDTIH